MITIEGKEYLNYVEALYELAAQINHLYENVYDKEEIATIVSGITARINYLYENVYDKEEINRMIDAINARINSLPAPLTAEQVRHIVDEELGVIINARY